LYLGTFPQIALEIVEAVHGMHEHGLFHADIKPGTLDCVLIRLLFYLVTGTNQNAGESVDDNQTMMIYVIVVTAAFVRELPIFKFGR
jgi:hypothetical protein